MRIGSKRSGRIVLATALTTGMVAVGLLTGTMAALAGTETAAGHRADAAELNAGLTGSAAQVPWRKVGPGWELVQYSGSTNTVGHIKPGPLTLYLVDPRGVRYRMFQWPARAAVQPMLADWSGDKTRALFTNGTSAVQQLNLKTGTMTTIRLRNASFATSVSYSRPSGSTLLMSDGTTGRLVVYRLNGTVLRNLPANSAGAIQSSNGAQFVLPAARGLRLVTSTGRLVRTLPIVSTGCSPLRFWTANTVLATCPITKDSPQDRLWLVPTSGLTPRALTSTKFAPPILNNLGAWQLKSGLYLQSAGACGSLYIVRQHSNGSTTVVNVRGTNGQHNQIVTANAGRLLVDAGTGCMSSNSLLWFNPATHAEQWLIKTPHYLQGVLSVVPYYSREN